VISRILTFAEATAPSTSVLASRLHDTWQGWGHVRDRTDMKDTMVETWKKRVTHMRSWDEYDEEMVNESAFHQMETSSW